MNGDLSEKAIKDYVKTGLWMEIDTTALSDNILVAKGFGTQNVGSPVAAAIQGNYAYTANYLTNSLVIMILLIIIIQYSKAIFQ
ncbi:MAG: hypothetical protein IPP79_12705 [Chitinophagaceae bacterium]|nr:hypothetical protein [Chitinophagaceae bacterium]